LLGATAGRLGPGTIAHAPRPPARRWDEAFVVQLELGVRNPPERDHLTLGWVLLDGDCCIATLVRPTDREGEALAEHLGL